MKDLLDGPKVDNRGANLFHAADTMMSLNGTKSRAVTHTLMRYTCTLMAAIEAARHALDEQTVFFYVRHYMPALRAASFMSRRSSSDECAPSLQIYWTAFWMVSVDDDEAVSRYVEHSALRLSHLPPPLAHHQPHLAQ